MTQIDNRSGLPHAWFEKLGPGGQTFDVLAVRGTFDFAAHGQRLTLATQQTPIVFGDEYIGLPEDNPLKSVLSREGDLVLFKPATDVYLTGTAQAEHHALTAEWLAAMRVGPVRKGLRLHGSRYFERRMGGWRLTPAELTTAVPLDYRKSFGGSYSTLASESASPEHVYKLDNPAGCGWLPDANALSELSKPARKQIAALISGIKRLDAPQIESPDCPVTHPSQASAAQGFAPLARWCEPRLRHAGTYDDAWREQVYPDLPDDFDPRFYQSAPPDLICDGHLDGDEPVMLAGLLPEGRAEMRLPGLVVLASTTGASGRKRAGNLVLDTVALDLDARQATLVWRGTFDRTDAVREIAVGAIRAPDNVRDMANG